MDEWSTKNQTQVGEEIFGDSIHREVVGRSVKLLRFLSSMEDSLTTEHLDLIWKSCVGKAEPELQVGGGGCSGVFVTTLSKVMVGPQRICCC